MEAAGLPALLIHQPQNIRYISGFFMMGYFFYHALLVPQKATTPNPDRLGGGRSVDWQ